MVRVVGCSVDLCHYKFIHRNLPSSPSPPHTLHPPPLLQAQLCSCCRYSSLPRSCALLHRPMEHWYSLQWITEGICVPSWPFANHFQPKSDVSVCVHAHVCLRVWRSFLSNVRNKVRSRTSPVPSFYFDILHLANYWGCDGKPRV